MTSWRLYPAACAVFLGCGGAVSAAGNVSFSRDIAPVLQNRCATCHLTGQEAGNMALHSGGAYASLVNISSVESKLLRVKPGLPEQSYLMLKLEGRHLDAGGTGQRMPLAQPPLDETTLQKIRDWITTGATKD
jgi:hypothetical protein